MAQDRLPQYEYRTEDQKFDENVLLIPKGTDPVSNFRTEFQLASGAIIDNTDVPTPEADKNFRARQNYKGVEFELRWHEVEQCFCVYFKDLPQDSYPDRFVPVGKNLATAKRFLDSLIVMIRNHKIEKPSPQDVHFNFLNFTRNVMTHIEHISHTDPPAYERGVITDLKERFKVEDMDINGTRLQLFPAEDVHSQAPHQEWKVTVNDFIVYKGSNHQVVREIFQYAKEAAVQGEPPEDLSADIKLFADLLLTTKVSKEDERRQENSIRYQYDLRSRSERSISGYEYQSRVKEREARLYSAPHELRTVTKTVNGLQIACEFHEAKGRLPAIYEFDFGPLERDIRSMHMHWSQVKCAADAHLAKQIFDFAILEAQKIEYDIQIDDVTSEGKKKPSRAMEEERSSRTRETHEEFFRKVKEFSIQLAVENKDAKDVIDMMREGHDRIMDEHLMDAGDYEFLPKHLKLDKDLAFYVITNLRWMPRVPDELASDRDFMLRAIGKHYRVLHIVHKTLLDDDAFLEAVVSSSPHKLNDYCFSLRQLEVDDARIERLRQKFTGSSERPAA